MNIPLIPVYFALLLAPIIFLPRTFNTYEIPKAILINTSILWTVGLLLLRTLSKKNKHLKYNPLLIAATIYFFVKLITSLSGHDLNRSIFGHYFRQNGLINHFTLLLLLFWFTQIKITKKITKLLTTTLLLGNILPALYAIYQKISIQLGTPPDLAYNQRPISTFSNPNFLAGYLVLTLPYILCLPRKKKFQKIFFYFFLVINIIAILVTESRSAFLALTVQILLYLFFTHRLNKKTTTVVIAFSILILSFISYIRPSSLFDNRHTIWKKGIEAFSKRPFLGWGTNNFDTAFRFVLKPEDLHEKNMVVDQAHNIFIENLTTGGIITFTALSLFLFLALKTSLRQLPHQKTYPLSFSIFLSLIGYIIYSQLNINSYIQEFMFFLNLSILSSISPNKKLKIKKSILLLTFPILFLLFILNLRLQFADLKFKEAFTLEQRGNIEEAGALYQQTYLLYPFEQFYNFKYHQFFP